MIEIKELCVKIIEENKPIIKSLNLTIQKGEIHAIMGPNGSGKSTLSKIIAGDPQYEVTSGNILVNGVSILEFGATERALMGLFLAFQYPVEIPGVNNAEFLRMAYNSINKSKGIEEVDPYDFDLILKAKLSLVEMSPEFLNRPVNVGFSGGEKKRNEILQMAVLDPQFSVLDETDSGLDIDALREISEAIVKLRTKNNAFLLITHYQRLLEYVVPDFVHIMVDGKIVKSGDATLATELDKKGYEMVVAEK